MTRRRPPSTPEPSRLACVHAARLPFARRASITLLAIGLTVVVAAPVAAGSAHR